MGKKRLHALLLAAGAAFLLSGCGSAVMSGGAADTSAIAAAPTVNQEEYLYDTGYGESGYKAEEAPADEAVAEETDYEAEGAEAKAPEVSEDPRADRKLITTMYLSAETEYFDELMGNLEKQIAGMGGYIESSEQWNGKSDYYGNRIENRNASLTVRVPADKLGSFLTMMEENSNITSKSTSVEDVTLAYVDLESRKKALLTEQDRLLELMDMAETVEDLIAIEDKLADVRYELESMESQLRTYDNKINYSTVYLHVQEVERLTPPEEPTTWGRIKNGFSKNLYGLGMDIENLFISIVIYIPYILAWLVVIAVVLLILFALVKREKKKKEKRRLKRQQISADTAETQENMPKDNQGENPLSGKLPQEAEKLPKNMTKE